MDIHPKHLNTIAFQIGAAHATPLKTIQFSNKNKDVWAKADEETVDQTVDQIVDQTVDESMEIVEEGSTYQLCIRVMIDKISEINANNEKEIQQCVSAEDESSKAKDEAFSAAKKTIDDATRNIIVNLEKCLKMSDHVESSKCTSKYDSVNKNLTDNSGSALKLLESVRTDISNIRAERKFCVDQSIRSATKKINEEQKKIQNCLDN